MTARWPTHDQIIVFAPLFFATEAVEKGLFRARGGVVILVGSGK